MSDPTLLRQHPDSRERSEPLVMVRVLVPRERLAATVAFYELTLGIVCDMRFDYPDAGLVLASVGGVLIIGGDAQALLPFAATDATFLVASLDEQQQRWLVEQGAEIVEPPKAVPTGRNMLVRHPDGLLVEYVEHRPQPGEETP